MLYIYVNETTRAPDLERVVAPIIRKAKVPHKVLTTQSALPILREGDVMVAMGKAALKKLADKGVVPKNRSTTSLRQKEHPMGKGILFVTFDANIGNLDYRLEVDLQIDLKLVVRKCKTGSIAPKLGKYRYVKDFTDVIANIKKLHAMNGKKVKVETDLETLGLDYVRAQGFIVSVAFTYKTGQSDVIRFGGHEDQPTPNSKLYKQIHWLLTTDMISLGGANLKYDLNWIFYKWGIHCTNFQFDTTLVGSLLDENRSNSLNNHTKIYTEELGGYDDEFNDLYDKSRMDLIPDEPFLGYAGGDTDATHRVREEQTKELMRDPALCNFYINLLHPAARGFEVMEQNGMRVNDEKLLEFGKELDDIQADLEKRILAKIPNRVKRKHSYDLRVKDSLISDFFFTPYGLGLSPLMTTATGKAATSMKHLQMFGENHPDIAEFVAELKAYNQAGKMKSTYVDGFRKHLREDGYFHPSYILFKGGYGDDGDESGTVTGRLAAKDPAVQTIPKHSDLAKKLRACYEPPEGYAVVEWDYSQGELRVVAVVAREDTMIRAYKDNMDLHMLTGGAVAGYTYEQMLALKDSDPKLFKKLRQGGKPANFGLLYGMSAEGYQAYARDNYGVHMSLAEARKVRREFFERYHELPRWHERCKFDAKRTGIIRSPLGRIRHLPLINSRDGFTRSKAERQSINSGIQSTLSDMLIMAIGEFTKKYGRPEGCKFFAMIHDAILGYVKIDELDYWIPIVKEFMENLPLEEKFGWCPDVPMIADAEFSLQNLATMQEWK